MLTDRKPLALSVHPRIPSLPLDHLTEIIVSPVLSLGPEPPSFSTSPTVRSLLPSCSFTHRDPPFPSFSSLSLSLFLSLRKSLPIVPPSFLLTLPHGSGKLTFSDTFLPPLRLPGAVRLSHVLCKRPLLLSAPVQWLFLLWARARSNFQSHFASCASTSPPDAIASPRARLVLSPAHSAIANHPQPPPLLLFLFP